MATELIQEKSTYIIVFTKKTSPMATTTEDFSFGFGHTKFSLVNIMSNLDDEINGDDFFEKVETYWMTKVKTLYLHIHI